jgi:hypothetical protein
VEIIRAGRAIIFTDTYVRTAHLTFVLTDPDEERKVVIVSVMTRRHFSDATVVLNPGDHPWIRRESTVQFDTARFCAVRRLERAVQTNAGHWQADMSASLLARVCAGLIASSRTIHAVKDYFRDRPNAG